MSLSIQFIGGAGTVTGSKYLVTYKDKKILIDCGMFQGLKSLRLKNWDGFPVDASEVDCIILTHAHIDHSGYIPRLIKKGFRGKIYATEATQDLCAIMLPDAGYLAEEEAEYLNRKKRTKHDPALPLFTMKEAEDSLKYFVPTPFDQTVALGDSVRFQFRYSGHILGAASVVLTLGTTSIGFTGDVGRLEDLVFFGPAPMPEVDYLVTESTYGNRHHADRSILEQLEETVNETYARKGVIIIPAFAVGRAQTLMYALYRLRKENRIPDFPMYLNSPMATDVSDLLRRHHQLHKLTEAECREMCRLVKYVRTPEESKALNEKDGPMLVISASGMMTGGRVLHHLKAFAQYEKNTILLAGFQAAGTRGEALEKGVDELKIHGDYVPIRAQVKSLDNISAHADYRELIKWFSQTPGLKPRKVFITHGEPSAADELRRRLRDQFGWECCIPELLEAIEL